ncbi:Aste57867_3271 [Aphanomyces stellatus]|uniref:Aste57867_3271 protein n=1 Tax=Aphanomyces stellatus TaxID=120398 RepID=A0A485KA24_9STRA|nr:hypothetical protein As57867_003261 [Aphanomyces stellatus]VFT80443.1 Aste57867_3271 [Aphanomyces stellatus]
MSLMTILGRASRRQQLGMIRLRHCAWTTGDARRWASHLNPRDKTPTHDHPRPSTSTYFPVSTGLTPPTTSTGHRGGSSDGEVHWTLAWLFEETYYIRVHQALNEVGVFDAVEAGATSVVVQSDTNVTEMTCLANDFQALQNALKPFGVRPHLDYIGHNPKRLHERIRTAIATTHLYLGTAAVGLSPYLHYLYATIEAPMDQQMAAVAGILWYASFASGALLPRYVAAPNLVLAAGAAPFVLTAPLCRLLVG